MNVHRLVAAEIHAERLVVPASATTVCATFEWREGQSCESENMFHTKCMTKINKSWFCDACVAAGAVACVGSDEDGFDKDDKDVEDADETSQDSHSQEAGKMSAEAILQNRI